MTMKLCRHDATLQRVAFQVLNVNLIAKMSESRPLHYKCRGGKYPRCDVNRFDVPDEKVPWEVPFQEYKPIDYTSESIKRGPVYADKLDITRPGNVPRWNDIDGKINRKSLAVEVYDVIQGLPRNPIGRTGIQGRGCLGRWGPNHAADPIVTRWKTEPNGQILRGERGKRILQFIAIQRRDTGEWAIPGGMVDAGENVSITLRREFGEEALNALEATDDEKDDIEDKVATLFETGQQIYQGYVDDPRNTDNAWMETTAMNFHDEKGDSVGQFHLHAGDDAVGVSWREINSELKLYASHIHFIKGVVDIHGANW